MSKEYTEAISRLDKFIPYECWQGGEMGSTAQLMRSNSLLTYNQRLHLISFLAGNGVSHADIGTLLLPRLRDNAARLHVQSTLNAIASEIYNDSWHFFNVHLQMKTFLKHPTRPLPDKYYSHRKLVHEWDTFCQHCRRQTGKYPTMAQHECFLSSNDAERAALVFS